MSSPELLRFFHDEAGEYLDAIETMLAAAALAPDAGAFVAAARALRGSATMARVPRVAELALVLERIANGVRDGELEWTTSLHSELRAAVTDLRSLVDQASQWTPAADQQADQRLATLRPYAPAAPVRKTPTTPTANAAPVFIALQTSAIASDLERVVSDASHRGLLDDVQNRLRGLRGIAGVADYPPLGDVADAVEHALRQIAPDALLSPQDTELLAAGAAVFRRASADLRARGRFDADNADMERFSRVAAWSQPVTDDASPVVPIEDLYYSDVGPHVVSRPEKAATSAEQRFRDESRSRAEQLRRLVARARVASDPLERESVQRELREQGKRIETLATSFGAQQVASYFGDLARRPGFLGPAALEGLDAGARVLLGEAVPLEEVERRLAVLVRARLTTPTPPAGVTPGGTPRTRTPSPASGAALRSLLDAGLSGLSQLDDEPLSEPAQLEDDTVVPVEELLYRGRAALLRAIELRDAMRARGTFDPESLYELYDLLDLARAE